jgi:hypothetical protein
VGSFARGDAEWMSFVETSRERSKAQATFAHP